jgi:hypothetical protein
MKNKEEWKDASLLSSAAGFPVDPAINPGCSSVDGQPSVEQQQSGLRSTNRSSYPFSWTQLLLKLRGVFFGDQG